MKHARDLKHTKSVSAIALLYKGKEAGSIVSNWSDNPSGTVCTTTVTVYEGPLKITRKETIDLMGKKIELKPTWTTARAGGYGYCKFSQSVGEAMGQTQINGCGEGAVRELFESHGYTYITIL